MLAYCASASHERKEHGMSRKMMWSMLIHLGYNMWYEEGNDRGMSYVKQSGVMASPTLRLNRQLWDDYMIYQKEAGVNTLIIDLGEGMLYESHPELAVKGSWSRDKISKELHYLRSLGFEVVPKLNFSACHDEWLKDYSRMLSTPVYYQVCSDLIQEVCEVFQPKYFHLGMDEETYNHQKNYNYAVIRQNDLWWKDFYFLVDCVEKQNVRPWIWSDYIWNHPDTFLKKMPKSVLQSNWYYGMGFEHPQEGEDVYIKSFDLLEEHGYDQVPTGSNWARRENMEALVKYCADRISPDRLLGFMQTPWVNFEAHNRNVLIEAADTLAAAKKAYESK